MSHIVMIDTEIRDIRAVQSACARLDLPAPNPGEVQFLSGKVSGLLVHLTSWKFPVVCQLQTGALKYDDYEGRWGERKLTTGRRSWLYFRRLSSRALKSSRSRSAARSLSFVSCSTLR